MGNSCIAEQNDLNAAGGLTIVPQNIVPQSIGIALTPTQIAQAWQVYAPGGPPIAPAPIVPCEVTSLRAEVAALEQVLGEYKALTTHLWDVISKSLGGGIPAITNNDKASAPKVDAKPALGTAKALPATALKRQTQATGLRLPGE